MAPSHQKGNVMFRRRAFLLAFSVFPFLFAACSGEKVETPLPGKIIDVGDASPNFRLPDASGRFFGLQDVREGWFLVLVFYRGHWCDACLKQLTEIKEHFQEFVKHKTALAAISVDSPGESAFFQERWGFPFPILSDRRLKLIDAFGLRHPKGHEGKDISRPAVVILSPSKRVVYKYVGKSPVDRPSIGDLLYTLEKLQKTEY